MKIEDRGHVSEGRILLRIFKEKGQEGLIARPDSSIKWSPIAQIIQVGAQFQDIYKPGEWIYVSPYAGTIMALEDGDDSSPNEGRMVITPIDILGFFEDSPDVAAYGASLSG